MKLALRLISIAWQLFVATITLSCAFLSGKWYYNDTASLDKMNVEAINSLEVVSLTLWLPLNFSENLY
ncbi:hypothetical protein GLIP_2978 [Aliiglaciecola lipolytica E3]|uniref:Uncharacterized protein n=1 Tax=Aliiglaciecola lipolytica E3 TaxID=1127673 RepID=K6X4P2_9ALTE|nr:hypothetical protein GLIP_2978 [Aliiglaciecola lipolytica E3]